MGKAINGLVEHIQAAIGNESQLHYRLVLEGENFLIDQDVILCPMPNPIQVSPSNHQFATKGVLTTLQIKELVKIFKTQNAIGIIEYGSISGILRRLSNNLHAQNDAILPALWKDFDDSQLYLLLTPAVIPYHSNQFVNWKLFIISLMMQTLTVINDTVAVASLDTLFDLKQALIAKDKEASGKLTHSQFSHVRFWFDKSHQNVWQNILFDLFECNTEHKEENDKSQLIDYEQLLFHSCFNDQSHCGVEKMIA